MDSAISVAALPRADAAWPPRSGVRRRLAEVGRDGGRFVLRFAQALDGSPHEVWAALVGLRGFSSPCLEPDCASCVGPPDGTGVCAWVTGTDWVRWEIDRLGRRSFVTLTVCIDDDDLEEVALSGVRYHLCFERAVERIAPSARQPRRPTSRRADLELEYRIAVAAALADTD